MTAIAKDGPSSPCRIPLFATLSFSPSPGCFHRISSQRVSSEVKCLQQLHFEATADQIRIGSDWRRWVIHQDFLLSWGWRAPGDNWTAQIMSHYSFSRINLQMCISGRWSVLTVMEVVGAPWTSTRPCFCKSWSLSEMAEVLLIKGWLVYSTDRSDMQEASWRGFERSRESHHGLSTKSWVLYTGFPFSSWRPLHCDSHFADGATETQRLYDFSKFMQLTILALGPNGVWLHVSAPLSKG